MKKKAFILKPPLAEKVEKMKEEMGLKDSGEVLLKAIQLLDIALGRKVILKEKGNKKTIETEDFARFNSTSTSCTCNESTRYLYF